MKETVVEYCIRTLREIAEGRYFLDGLDVLSYTRLVNDLDELEAILMGPRRKE